MVITLFLILKTGTQNWTPYLVRMFDFCSKHNYPMVINVHYWYLRDNPAELEKLRKFVMEYAIPKGAIPTRLSDLFL